MKKLFVLTGVLALITACSGTQTVKDAQKYADCYFPDAPTKDAPAWVCDVMPKDLAIGAMGYAKKSAAGMNVMRKIAINNARVELASQFQTDVNNMFKQAIENSVDTSAVDDVAEKIEKTIESFENVTKNVVTRSLSNSRIVVSQVSPAGGLYVLVGMDKETYQANLNQVVDSAAKEASLWNQFNSERAAEDLESALNSLKSM